MAKEREDSFADDPLEEINLDNDDLDDLLGDADKEDSDTKSSDEADDDLLSSDDLLEDDDLLSADDLEPETSDSESDPDNSAEISKEELDSLLAEADAPAEEDGGDEAPPEEPAIDLEEFEEVLSEDDSDDSDATDILGDDDSAEEYPEVPDTLPQELMGELEEDSPGAEDSEEDDGGDTDALAEDSESEEEEKKTKGFKPKGKGKKGKKGFAAKGKTGKAGKGKKEPKKAAADRKKPVAAKSGGKTIDIICSECYSVLSLSATWEEDLVTCPECFHVGKKPDDSFLRTVSTAKARESKKAKMLALLSVLVIVSFTGFMFLKSAYGDANSLTAAEQAPLQADVNSAVTDLTNAKTRNRLPLNKDKQEDLGPLEVKVGTATSALAGFLGHPDKAEDDDTELTATANGIVVVTRTKVLPGSSLTVLRPEAEETVLVGTEHHFLPDVPKEEHKDTVDRWAQICLYGGGLFLLLLIWQACRYEGNRWEAYF
ncbi:MAG: hypothetical protein VX254_02360 [Planctomycetota bacterium]|nr:hypothetical protein [Planctomycetota bacterium]